MRGGDFYSRIAENGFWICLQGDIVEAQRAAERFSLTISKGNQSKDPNVLLLNVPRAEFSLSEWNGKSNPAEWIQEIDLRYFTKA